MKKIAILFSGKGSNFSHIVNTLHQKELEVAVALTNKPEAKGIAVAKAHGIALEVVDAKDFSDREAFDAVLVEKLKAYDVDLTVLAGFMRILTPVFTRHVPAINLHPSLLPRHRGLNAIVKSYEDEYEEGGVSVHYVSDELDAGEIIVQKSLAKKGLSFTVYDQKIRTMEKEALVEAIQKMLL